MPFCRECGKDVQSDWVTCPYCSESIGPPASNSIGLQDSVVMGDVSISDASTECVNCESTGVIQIACSSCKQMCYCNICEGEVKTSRNCSENWRLCHSCFIKKRDSDCSICPECNIYHICEVYADYCSIHAPGHRRAAEEERVAIEEVEARRVAIEQLNQKYDGAMSGIFVDKFTEIEESWWSNRGRASLLDRGWRIEFDFVAFRRDYYLGDEVGDAEWEYGYITWSGKDKKYNQPLKQNLVGNIISQDALMNVEAGYCEYLDEHHTLIQAFSFAASESQGSPSVVRFDKFIFHNSSPFSDFYKRLGIPDLSVIE